jgi:soluble lytic murein transglycosylase-like protein
MSAPAIGPTTEGGSADALSASRRVQQLQALIAQVGSGSTTSFAAALEAASTGPAGAGQAGGPPAAAPASTGNAYAGAAGPEGGPATAPASTGNAYAGAAGPEGGPATAATSTGNTYTGTGVGGASAYDATISAVATRYGLDPAVLHGLIQQESGFNPSARSGAGALGLTQLMPSTAASLGVREPLDPTQSIEGGARYLSEQLQRFGGNIADALAAYNAGPGAVEQYGGVPPYAETQEYVAKVMANANAYRQSSSSAGIATGTLA